ncbi:hypothetical protein GCM10027347_42880 [Larkinella harenae]
MLGMLAAHRGLIRPAADDATGRIFTFRCQFSLTDTSERLVKTGPFNSIDLLNPQYQSFQVTTLRMEQIDRVIGGLTQMV